MSSVVLDSSVALALLFDEPGSDAFSENDLDAAVMSAVNLAEVQGRLVGMGRSVEEAWQDIACLGFAAETFSPEQARLAGALLVQTKPYGLSLGDRCCLALAMTLGAPVYTADKAWKNLKIGVPVHVIR